MLLAAGPEAGQWLVMGQGESEAGTPAIGQGWGISHARAPANCALLGRTVCEPVELVVRVLPLYGTGLALPPLPETNQTVPGLPWCIFLPEDRRQLDEQGHQFCAAREKINL